MLHACTNLSQFLEFQPCGLTTQAVFNALAKTLQLKINIEHIVDSNGTTGVSNPFAPHALRSLVSVHT